MAKRRQKGDLGDYTNVLYVVLHGLIALFDIGHDGYMALVLEMGPDHRYLVGDWLAEQEIPPSTGSYGPMQARLLGLKAGKAELDAEKNPVLITSNIPPLNDPGIRAIVYLPRPNYIHYPLKGILPKKNPFSGNLDHLVKTPTHISNIRVFEYRLDDPDDAKEICLHTHDGRAWHCPFPLAQIDDIQLRLGVLHLYNEPDHVLGGGISHTHREFNASAELLGSNLLLIKDTKLDKPVSIPGLLEGELVFLSNRLRHAINAVYAARGSSTTVDSGSGPGQVCGGMNARLSPKEFV